jgi:hypothetical protein
MYCICGLSNLTLHVDLTLVLLDYDRTPFTMGVIVIDF